MHVIETTSPKDVAAFAEFDARKVWLGPDDRGIELEIVAVVLPGELLIIHRNLSSDISHPDLSKSSDSTSAA